MKLFRKLHNRHLARPLSTWTCKSKRHGARAKGYRFQVVSSDFDYINDDCVPTKGLVKVIRIIKFYHRSSSFLLRWYSYLSQIASINTNCARLLERIQRGSDSKRRRGIENLNSRGNDRTRRSTNPDPGEEIVAPLCEIICVPRQTRLDEIQLVRGHYSITKLGTRISISWSKCNWILRGSSKFFHSKWKRTNGGMVCRWFIRRFITTAWHIVDKDIV